MQNLLRILPRILLAAAFVTFGGMKIYWSTERDHESIAGPTWATWMLSREFLLAVAWFEVTTGLLLLLRWTIYSASAAFAVCLGLALFSLVMSLGGISIERCGCLGAYRMGNTEHWILIYGVILLFIASLLSERASGLMVEP